jgi:hypothetical protein
MSRTHSDNGDSEPLLTNSALLVDDPEALLTEAEPADDVCSCSYRHRVLPLLLLGIIALLVCLTVFHPRLFGIERLENLGSAGLSLVCPQVICPRCWPHRSKRTQPRATVSANDSTAVSEDSSAFPPRDSRLGDGCSHVYLDLGTNTGIQLRKLFEPTTHGGGGESIHPYFDQFFGKAEETNGRRHVCAFGFEVSGGRVEDTDQRLK